MLLCLYGGTGHCNALLPEHNYYVTASDVRVRATPGLEAEVVAKLQRGAMVTVVKATQEWAEIRSKDSRGYVKASFLSEVKPTTEGSSTFAGRLARGFKGWFMISLVAVGTIHTLRTRKKDSRFKTGFRLPALGFGDAVIIGVIAGLISSVAALITALTGYF